MLLSCCQLSLSLSLERDGNDPDLLWFPCPILKKQLMCGLWVYELNLSAGFDWNFRGMNEQHFFVRSNKANSDEANAGPTINEGTRVFMLIYNPELHL